MAHGPGKYDPELTEALRSVLGRQPNILGGILIIVGRPDAPEAGGFACQVAGSALVALPGYLRSVADQIEADLQRGML